MKVKEENEKAGLKLNIQKMKIMASSPIISYTGAADPDQQSGPQATSTWGPPGSPRLPPPVLNREPPSQPSRPRGPPRLPSAPVSSSHDPPQTALPVPPAQAFRG